MKKGDPLQTARLAGIMAAKRTSDVIPLCHPLPLSHVDVALCPLADGYDIEARVRTTAQTGVEMEALHAVAVAALTIYDMIKAVDKRDGHRRHPLVEKRGGQAATSGGDPRPLTILVGIYSPFAAWNIPGLARRSDCARRFRNTTFLHARSRGRSAALIPQPQVAFMAESAAGSTSPPRASSMDP